MNNKNVLDYAVEEAVKQVDAKAPEEERIKALEEIESIVREMIKDKLPICQISKFTKLSIEDIEKL